MSERAADDSAGNEESIAGGGFRRLQHRNRVVILLDALGLPTDKELVDAIRSFGLTDEELKVAIETWREGPSWVATCG
jgi:hypothetical protein